MHARPGTVPELLCKLAVWEVIMDRRLVPFALGAAAVLAIGGVVVASPAGAQSLTFTATVSGANEVPPSGSAATGNATFTVDTVTNEVCIDATVTGLSGPVEGSHIHEGTAGVNGPVVIDFSASLDTCVTSTAQIVTALIATPSAFYLNIHTDEFSSGEVRGQLALVPTTTTTTTTPAPSTITAPSTTSTIAPRPAVAPVAVAPRFTG